MSAPNEKRFAQLLSEGVHRMRLRTSKPIQVIQDELAAALGRNSGSALEYWRKGHLPSRLEDVETLARIIVRSAKMDREWLRPFLESAGHPYPIRIIEELFPGSSTEPSIELWGDGDGGVQDTAANPFVVGPPITRPAKFYGRAHEMEYLAGLWNHPPLQHAVIVGKRRSGKTSLLHNLRAIARTSIEQLRPDQRTTWSEDLHGLGFVYVDFQDARMSSQDRLLRHVLAALSLPIPEPCDLSRFLDTVSANLRQRAVILMDEMEAALGHTELDQRFWWSLRSLGSHGAGGKLGLLFTTQCSPTELAQTGERASPFLNIFGHTISLGPLDEPSARALVASSPIPFPPNDVEWILRQSACWPSLLQILCDTRLQALHDGSADDGWKARALERLKPFRYLLDG